MSISIGPFLSKDTRVEPVRAERPLRQVPPESLLDRGDGIVALLIWVVALGLYVRTLLPTVGIGDTAEFQYKLATLTVPHPTGYPLYVFLGKLFTLLPVGNEAYRVNLLSAVATAGAVGFVYLTARLAGAGRPGAALGSAVLTVAPVAWSWATIAEVYALHVFFVGAIVFLALLWSSGYVSATFLALALGISFGNHRGMVLLLPALGLLFLIKNRSNLRGLLRPDSLRSAIMPSIAFAVPWLMYLFIPLRGIPGHDGFWETLMYGGSGTALFAQVELMARNPLASAMNYFFEMAPAQLGLLMLPAFLGLVAPVLGFPRNGAAPARNVAVMLVGAYLTVLAFHLPVYGGDITGFMLPTFWILSVGVSLFTATLIQILAAMMPTALMRPFAGLAGFALLFGGYFAGPARIEQANFAAMDLSGHYEQEQRANLLLNSLEPNSVLVLNDDWLLIWQLKYQRYVANVRPDTAVVEGGAEAILRAMLQQARPAYAMDYVPALAAEGRLIPVFNFWRALEKPLEYRIKQSLNAVFDERVKLNGWSAVDSTLQPGGLLNVLLQWEALDRIDDDLVVFVHLLDVDGTSPVGWDAQPLHSELPTSTWRIGQKVDDPHGLLLPNDLKPGRYSLEIGMYPEGSTARLPIAIPGAKPADRILIGPFRVPVQPFDGAPGKSLALPFGDRMTLFGVDIPAKSAGDTTDLTLYWRSDRPADQDLTVTVQVLDPSGKLAAQNDQQPQSGRYPTSIWGAGDVVVDRHRLKIASVPSGSYRIIAAVYDATGRRLPVDAGDFAEIGALNVQR